MMKLPIAPTLEQVSKLRRVHRRGFNLFDLAKMFENPVGARVTRKHWLRGTKKYYKLTQVEITSDDEMQRRGKAKGQLVVHKPFSNVRLHGKVKNIPGALKRDWYIFVPYQWKMMKIRHAQEMEQREREKERAEAGEENAEEGEGGADEAAADEPAAEGESESNSDVDQKADG